MWRPELVIGICGSSSIDSLALWLVELREVKIDEEGFVSLCGLVVITLGIIVFSRLSSIFCISSIDHELLRDTVWFNDDVLNKDVSIRDLELFPRVTFIP